MGMMSREEFERDPAAACDQVLASGTALTIVVGSVLAPVETLLVLAPARQFHAEKLAQGLSPCHGTGICVLTGCPRKSDSR
jgi:hypothetical protein